MSYTVHKQINGSDNSNLAKNGVGIITVRANSVQFGIQILLQKINLIEADACVN